MLGAQEAPVFPGSSCFSGSPGVCLASASLGNFVTVKSQVQHLINKC